MEPRLGLGFMYVWVVLAGYYVFSTNADYTSDMVRKCTSEIQNGDISRAVETFIGTDKDDSWFIEQIISEGYNGVLENVHPILKFIKKLPSCDDREKAYLAIYNQTKANNQNWGTVVFHMHADMEDCEEWLYYTRKELGEQVDIVQRNWAFRISQEYWRTALNKESQQGCRTYMVKQWPAIIKIAYRDLSSMDDLIDLIKKATCYQSQLAMAQALVDEIESNEHAQQITASKIIEVVRALSVFPEEEKEEGRSLEIPKRRESASNCSSYDYADFSEYRLDSPASEDHDGEILHSCRMHVNSSIVPGVRFTNTSADECKTVYNGRVYVDRESKEMLTTTPGSFFQWIRSEPTSNLPPYAFAGGQTDEGETLYVVRCEFTWKNKTMWRPGYFQPSKGGFIYKGKYNVAGECGSEIEFLVCN